MNSKQLDRMTYVLNYRKQAIERRLDASMKRLAATEEQLLALKNEKEQATARLQSRVLAALDGSINAQAVTMGHIQTLMATAEHDAKQNRLKRNRSRYISVRDQAEVDIIESRASLRRVSGKLDGLGRVEKRLSLAGDVRAELADEESLSHITVQER